LDLRFKSYEVFKDFSQNLGMLSATANATKFAAQNYQNLLKSTQRQNFEKSPKIEILVFFKKKNLEEAL
jgi:hypothetical protein